MKSKNKGITLIALVITIIVLLILAGVAINMAINSDGLFGKANEAATGWNTAVQEERKIGNLLNILKGNEVTNPYEEKKWVKAWTCTNKTWSGEILAGNEIPEDIDIVAKLYATGKEITPLEYEGITFGKGAEYKLVIEGTGEMGEIIIYDDDELVEPICNAWMADLELAWTGQLCTMPYITEVTICDGIKNIPAEAFEYGVSLKQVIIGNDIQEVGQAAICNYSDSICDVIVSNERIAKLINGNCFRAIPKLVNEESIIKEKITAYDVKNNPIIYYGKDVIGYNCENNEAIEKWKIYHSDGENIYLLAGNSIKYDFIPAKDGVKVGIGEYYENEVLFGDDLLEKYKGAESITDNNVKPWLSYLNSYGTSTNRNMKATAYLLDTSIWNPGFKDEKKAKYAIGGPTLDMVEASHNARCSRKIEKKIEENGYIIKFKDEEEGEYDGYYTYAYDYIYQFVRNFGVTDGYAMLASPSGWLQHGMMSVYSNGQINGYRQTMRGDGMLIRPLVCLESDVQLEKITTESGEIVYKIAE